MKPYILISTVFLSLFFTHSGLCEKSGSKNECVILLHGLGRTSRSMNQIAARLKKEGYQTINCGYPSTENTIQNLAQTHVTQAVNDCVEQNPNKIHFITHSLGGILVRQYFQNNTIPNCGSIIMISPPNKGSEISDKLKNTFFYKWITGPAGQQLGTDEDSVPNKLEPIHVDVGIITGNKTIEPWFSMMIPGDDDGKVSVERAKLDEMNDFLVVKSAHPFIMQNSEVINQVVFYLANGKFKH